MEWGFEPPPLPLFSSSSVWSSQERKGITLILRFIDGGRGGSNYHGQQFKAWVGWMDFVATTRKYIVPFSKYLKIKHAGNCHPGQVFLAPVHFKDMTWHFHQWQLIIIWKFLTLTECLQSTCTKYFIWITYLVFTVLWSMYVLLSTNTFKETWSLRFWTY